MKQSVKCTLLVLRRKLQKSSNHKHSISSPKEEITVTKACELMNITPQYYYKSLEQERGYYSDIQIIEEELQRLRHQHPNLGLKKFYQGYFDEIRPRLQGSWGQHKVLELAPLKGWLKQKKRSFTKTTNSYHHYRVHRNLIKDKADIRSGEVLVSDITYLRAGLKFVYLFLITDLASRKIVGIYQRA